MITLFFKLFSKEYNVPYVKRSIVIQECIFPYENFVVGSSVKGKIYLRKTKIVYGYTNLLFKDYSKIQYSGILHLVYATSQEKTIELKPYFFEDDDAFLKSVYRLSV